MDIHFVPIILQIDSYSALTHEEDHLVFLTMDFVFKPGAGAVPVLQCRELLVIEAELEVSVAVNVKMVAKGLNAEGLKKVIVISLSQKNNVCGTLLKKIVCNPKS